MKLLLASLLLVYAVQSLPRFSRQLEDLEEYIPNDDDDYSGGDYDGEVEMADESDDDDDSFFENGKSRKSSRNAKVWEGHVEHDDNDKVDWRKLGKDEGWLWGQLIKTTVPLQAASKSSRKFKNAGNARKMSVEDIDDLFPTPPPFSPHKIGLEDDESLISDEVLHTPEDILPEVWGEDRMPVDIKYGLIKPKSQQHKSARRGGYVRKGLLDDIIGILHGESTINIYTKPVDKKKE